ncbi:hypothetical protein LPJ56_001788 [Coemansia sp. RSA 2599]|nr:hypothetical protein LPJ56_001788 [Coemansia sp. RSA 2599]
MATTSAQAARSEGIAQRRARPRVSPYDGAMARSTPQAAGRHGVRWQGLDEDIFSQTKPLADESCAKLVSDDDGDAGIESDDPTNTAMFLVESEENELNEIVPGTPQAFSKLSQLTVQSINRQRVRQTPGRTPLYRDIGAQDTPSRGSLTKGTGSSSKSLVSDDGSPSKKGDAMQLESLGAPVPVFQLPSPPKESTAGADGMAVPKSVRIMNSSRRAEMILDKIRASERTVEAPVLPKASPAEQRKRTPIKRNFERNEFAPIGFPSLATTRSNAGDKAPEPRPAESSEDNGAAGGANSNEQANYLLQTPPPKKSAAARHSADAARTPVTEQMKRINQLRTFLSRSEKQPQQFAILGTPAQAARRMSEADRTRLNLGRSPSYSRPGGQHDALGSQVPRFNLPEQQDMSAINLIDSMSFSQISSIHETSIGLEEDNHVSQQLLLSFSSTKRDEDSGSSKHRSMALVPHRGPGSLGTGCANIMDMSLQLTRSIAALDGGLRSQLEIQCQSGTGAAELGAVADAVERANAEYGQNAASGDARTMSMRSDELEGQVKTLRETMAETKDIVFSIRQELDQHKQGQLADDSRLDDIVRLLGALDMRLHMLEARQQQSLKASSKASSSGSIKVVEAVKPAEQQDVISLIGQLFVNCLTMYPLRIVGALVIILLLELITISGLGSRAMYELKHYLPTPPAPPS